jgi:hypothetical protein
MLQSQFVLYHVLETFTVPLQTNVTVEMAARGHRCQNGCPQADDALHVGFNSLLEIPGKTGVSITSLYTL